MQIQVNPSAENVKTPIINEGKKQSSNGFEAILAQNRATKVNQVHKYNLSSSGKRDYGLGTVKSAIESNEIMAGQNAVKDTGAEAPDGLSATKETPKAQKPESLDSPKEAEESGESAKTLSLFLGMLMPTPLDTPPETDDTQSILSAEQEITAPNNQGTTVDDIFEGKDPILNMDIDDLTGQRPGGVTTEPDFAAQIMARMPENTEDLLSGGKKLANGISYPLENITDNFERLPLDPPQTTQPVILPLETEGAPGTVQNIDDTLENTGAETMGFPLSEEEGRLTDSADGLASKGVIFAEKNDTPAISPAKEGSPSSAFESGGDSLEAELSEKTAETRPAKAEGEKKEEKTAPKLAESSDNTAKTIDLPALKAEGALRPLVQTPQRIEATPQTLYDTMVEQMTMTAQNGRTSVEIQLRTDYLGKVSIELVLADGQLEAKIKTDDPTVKSLIGSQVNQLIESLEQKGIKTHTIDVVYTGTSAGSFESSGGNPRESMSQEGRNKPLKAQGISKIGADSKISEIAPASPPEETSRETSTKEYIA